MTEEEYRRREAISNAFDVTDEVIESAFILIERKWPHIKHPPAEMVLSAAHLIARVLK